MHSRKRSSSSVYALPLLAPYASFSSCRVGRVHLRIGDWRMVTGGHPRQACQCCLGCLPKYMCRRVEEDVRKD
jgi:hypothetical protein